MILAANHTSIKHWKTEALMKCGIQKWEHHPGIRKKKKTYSYKYEAIKKSGKLLFIRFCLRWMSSRMSQPRSIFRLIIMSLIYSNYIVQYTHVSLSRGVPQKSDHNYRPQICSNEIKAAEASLLRASSNNSKWLLQLNIFCMTYSNFLGIWLWNRTCFTIKTEASKR